MSFLKQNNVATMTVAQRNEWYAGLTKQQKAVAIAEDVIDQLEAEKYIATSGSYAWVNTDNPQEIKTDKLDEIINSPTVTCSVCAVGSVFMSAVRLGNACTLKDLKVSEYDGNMAISDVKMENKLEEAFTVREYRAMEYMFEGSDIYGIFYDEEQEDGCSTEAYLEECYEEHYEELSSDDKLRKICANIIENKGVFTIPGVDLSNG